MGYYTCMTNTKEAYDNLAISKKSGRLLRQIAKRNKRTIIAQAEIIIEEAAKKEEIRISS